jgi:ABC-type thiamine transport system ATPase subunit
MNDRQPIAQLAAAGLEGLEERLFGKLSGGQRRFLRCLRGAAWRGSTRSRRGTSS